MAQAKREDRLQLKAIRAFYSHAPNGHEQSPWRPATLVGAALASKQATVRRSVLVHLSTSLKRPGVSNN